MLHLKAKHEENPEQTSKEDVAKAVKDYNACAALFNEAISTQPGAMLNVILRYPVFETVSED